MWDYPSKTRLAKTGFPNLYAKEPEMSATQTVPQGKSFEPGRHAQQGRRAGEEVVVVDLVGSYVPRDRRHVR